MFAKLAEIRRLEADLQWSHAAIVSHRMHTIKTPHPRTNDEADALIISLYKLLRMKPAAKPNYAALVKRLKVNAK